MQEKNVKRHFYASAIIGRIIQRFRQTAKNGSILPSSEMGKRLGIAGSTLRMLECGTIPVPPAISFGMANEFGYSLRQVSLVVNVASFVDHGETFEESIVAVENVKRLEPSLAFYMDIVINSYREAINGNDRLKVTQNDKIVDELSSYLSCSWRPLNSDGLFIPGGYFEIRLEVPIYPEIPPINQEKSVDIGQLKVGVQFKSCRE